MGLYFKLIIITLCFLLTSCAGGNWTKADTVREVAVFTLHTIDWGQTRTIAKNPDRYYEINPILGKHPSIGKVDTYMFIGTIVRPVISYHLPPKYRKWWQYLSIGTSGAAVANNYNAGIKVDF